MIKILHCKLLTYQIDPGDYVIYVFRNLDSLSTCDKYIMCTKHPNWQSKPVKIGQKGYLKIKEIEAGKDTWYDCDSKESIPYKYDGVQFFEFIEEKQEELQQECIMI
jgi:hypothetical protein|nr:MAG TPA: hypothetical protein [Bacteriophage sp.]